MQVLQVVDAHFGIDGGGGQPGMVQQLLDEADIRPALVHVSGATVAQQVAASGPVDRSLDAAGAVVDLHWLVTSSPNKIPVWRSWGDLARFFGGDKRVDDVGRVKGARTLRSGPFPLPGWRGSQLCRFLPRKL